MPIYEYSCEGCGKLHEIIQKFSDAPIAECPDCGGRMRKLISNSAFVLKGTGWYSDGYASGDGKKAIEAEKGGKKAPETPKEANKETKTETTAKAEKTET